MMVQGVSVAAIDVLTGASYSGISDANGVAYLWSMPSSRYSVYANKTGYYEWGQEMAFAGSYMEVSVPMRPTSGNGGTKVSVGIHAIDASSTPVSGANVVITGGGTTYSGTTNSFGVCLFSDIPMLIYTYVVSKIGFNQASGYFDSATQRDVYVTMGVVVVPVTISIGAQNDAGVMLAGIPVSVNCREGGFNQVKTTGASGFATFTSAPTGHYDILINNDATISLTNVNITSNYSHTAVIAEYNPQTFTVRVQVLQQGGTPLLQVVTVNLVGGSYSNALLSDNGGSVTFTNVPAGYDYRAGTTLNGVVYVSSYFNVSGDTSTQILVPNQGGPTIVWEKAAPAYKNGTYSWKITYNITPIPFVDNWIVDLKSQVAADEAALNAAIQSQGVNGVAKITSKDVSRHLTGLGNVDQFTVLYTFTVTDAVQGTPIQILPVTWVPIIQACLPALLNLAIAIIILLSVREIRLLLEALGGEGGQNVPILVGGAVAVAVLYYFSKTKGSK